MMEVVTKQQDVNVNDLLNMSTACTCDGKARVFSVEKSSGEASVGSCRLASHAGVLSGVIFGFLEVSTYLPGEPTKLQGMKR